MKIFKVLIFSLLILCSIFIGCSILYYLKKNSRFTVIQKNDVKITFLRIKGINYTLNFDEQNQLIEWINRGASQKGLSSSFPKSNPPFFELYLFNNSIFTITPFKVDEKSFFRLTLDGIAKDYLFPQISDGHLDSLLQKVED